MEESRFVQRLAGLVVGTTFIMVGVFMVILGLTLLPVIGILLAIPIMFMSLYFIFPEVKVHTVENGKVVYSCDEDESWCQWPPPGYPKEA